MSIVRDRLNPRYSMFPAMLAISGGLLHGIDQLLYFRAGPIPILVTAPVVAVLTYLRMRPETGYRRLRGLLVWGLLGSGFAVLGVYLLASSHQLPRPMTEPEMVLYDFGLFLWFVLALTGAYGVAARTDRTLPATAAILAGPALQLAWTLFGLLIVESGLYA